MSGLTLTIREGEAVGVGSMVIRVQKIRGKNAVLNFEGPPEVSISRRELPPVAVEPTGGMLTREAVEAGGVP